MSPKLPVSLDCPFLIAPSGVSNVYSLHLGKHLIRDAYDMSSNTNIENVITEQRVPIVEQEQITFSEHLSTPRYLVVFILHII